MNIKDQIRAEIDARRQNMVYELYGLPEDGEKYIRVKGMHDAYVDMLTYIEYHLPEQPVLPGIDEEGIHELRESEDERIRKALIELVGLTPDYMFGEIKPNKFIAYLEKQKEHQDKSDAHNESSWSGMISSSDKDKNLDEIAQDYVDGVKEYNPEPTWDLVQTAVCYGYYLAEQKEQKPDDDPLNDPKFLKGFDTGREVQRIFDEKKPAEWSEEDEEKINNIFEIIEHCITIPHSGGTLTLSKEYKKELQCFIKSLRPSWKPSEEQMEALLNAEKYLNAGLQYGSATRIAKLYEQLKKLM